MRNHLAWFFAFLAPTLAFSAGEKTQWVLEKSEITYTVTHPLHVVHGKTLSAKGKGVCYGNHCDFLVAVPVKSFDSKDENRDLHMQEVTRAGLYPLIEVKARAPEIRFNSKPKTILADLEVDFAGTKVQYPKVLLTVVEWSSDEAHITGGFKLSLKAFGITPPSLLTMPIRDEVPVELDMVWKLTKANKK
jgi:hypothetical protein